MRALDGIGSSKLSASFTAQLAEFASQAKFSVSNGPPLELYGAGGANAFATIKIDANGHPTHSSARKTGNERSIRC